MRRAILRCLGRLLLPGRRLYIQERMTLLLPTVLANNPEGDLAELRRLGHGPRDLGRWLGAAVELLHLPRFADDVNRLAGRIDKALRADPQRGGPPVAVLAEEER